MLSITSERKTIQQPLQLRVLWSSIVTEMLCYYQPGQNEQIYLCRWAMNEQSALQAAAWRDNSIQVATMLPCTQLGQDWADKLSNKTISDTAHSKKFWRERYWGFPLPACAKQEHTDTDKHQCLVCSQRNWSFMMLLSHSLAGIQHTQ